MSKTVGTIVINDKKCLMGAVVKLSYYNEYKSYLSR